MGCAFFIRSLAQLGVKSLERFWRFMSQNSWFCDSCIPLGLEQRYHNFRGSKPPTIGPNRHFTAKMPKSYNGNISKTVRAIKLKIEAQPRTTNWKRQN